MYMNRFKRLINKGIKRVVDHFTGSGLMQEENIPEGERYITPGFPELIRQCGAEGIVLLKNDGNMLPIKADETVSVFGRCQNDWFYVGYGSGGDVHPPYKVSLMDGLRNANVKFEPRLAALYKSWSEDPENAADHGWWGHWPYFHEEMPLDSETVADAAKNSSVALVVIGRAAGEDHTVDMFPVAGGIQGIGVPGAGGTTPNIHTGDRTLRTEDDGAARSCLQVFHLAKRETGDLVYRYFFHNHTPATPKLGSNFARPRAGSPVPPAVISSCLIRLHRRGGPVPLPRCTGHLHPR
jgi:hypothetical protein